MRQAGGDDAATRVRIVSNRRTQRDRAQTRGNQRTTNPSGFYEVSNFETMNMTKELSESLLAACKAAGIEKPRYIAQDKDGTVWHYDGEPNTTYTSDVGIFAFDPDIGEHAISLDHPPYADYWRESLIEWVEPQEMLPTVFIPHEGEPLADVLARHPEHVADVSKKVSGIEALVCDDIAKRQQVGIAKYGTTVAENMLSHTEWLQHAYEECLDMAVYLKRAMAELQTTSGKIEIENEDY